MKSGKWGMLRFRGGDKGSWNSGLKLEAKNAHVRCEGELRLLEQEVG